MFGKDHFTLSKPMEIRTVAKSFSDTIKKVHSSVSVPITSANRNAGPGASAIKPVQSKPVANMNKGAAGSNQEVNNSHLNEIEFTIRKGYIKLELVKPFARSFLKQVNNQDEIKENESNNQDETQGKIIFSYSDSKDRWGKLEDKGEKIRIICLKKQQAEFAEEQIDIYSINDYKIELDGLFIQVKGWGNLKDLSLVNALKNFLKKLPANNPDKKTGIICNYSLSSMTAISDGGWECKVKVTPGRISL